MRGADGVDARAWCASPTATVTGGSGTRMSNADLVPGVSINDLTDPESLDVSGNAALSGVRVTVAQVGEGT